MEEPSKGSYGINVARLAGFRKEVLDRAVEVSQLMLAGKLHQLTAAAAASAANATGGQRSASTNEQTIMNNENEGGEHMMVE